MAGKARVHELAKELGVTSKEVLSRLSDQGEFVKSASSTVEAPVARRLRESFGGGKAPEQAPEKAPAKKPAAKAAAPTAPAPAAPAPVAPAALPRRREDDIHGRRRDGRAVHDVPPGNVPAHAEFTVVSVYLAPCSALSRLGGLLSASTGTPTTANA